MAAFGQWNSTYSALNVTGTCHGLRFSLCPQAMEDPSAVRSPKPVHNCSAPPKVEWMTAPAKGGTAPPQPEGYPPRCNSENELEVQAPCSYFCINGRLQRQKHVWLKAKLFDELEPIGPRLSQMPKD